MEKWKVGMKEKRGKKGKKVVQESTCDDLDSILLEAAAQRKVQEAAIQSDAAEDLAK